MAPDDGLLAGVAGAILDGTPVDWETAESGANPAEAALLPHLKTVSGLARVYRQPLSPVETPSLWGHLRILERIGEGAFGEVYRAWDTRLDREVALKLLPAGPASGDARATSIITEGRLLARVRHPNVVTIYGAERIGDRVGLWMEFVKGRTLEQLIQDGRHFTAVEATDIGIELARAVAAVHEAGLLHRDIKAQNVMLADDGRVVLMDFGTGLELTDGGGAALAGTPRYLAPELFAGQVATAASDLYSLGVLLYRLVTESYPVKAADLSALRQAHARGGRARVREEEPGVPPGLARVIDHLLDPEPDRRGAGAAALGVELAALRNARRRRPWVRAAIVAAVLTVGMGVAWVAQARSPVIAVLPFAVSGDEPDRDLFSAGLTDQIIRHLVGIDGLRVRSRTSSAAFSGTATSARDIGARLDADLLLEGTVAPSERTLRVSARLIQAAGGAALWSDAWEADRGDVFAIPDRIARAIAETLKLNPGSTPPRRRAEPRVQQAFLVARGLIDKRGIENARRAAALFEEVIRLDPDFAPAWAGRANAYGQVSMTYDGMPISEALPILRDSALRAIRLDPSLAEAHAAMGLLHTRDFNWDAAVEAYRRAIALDGTLTHAATTYVLWALTPLERFDEAEQVLATARANDPLSLDVQRELGNVRLLTGRYAEAVSLYQSVLAVDPASRFVRLYSALTWAERPKEAVALLENAGAGAHGYLAHAYVQAGRRADAERLLEGAQPFPMRVAMIQAALGNVDGAFEALDRMMVGEPHRVPRLLVYPEMSMARGDPRYVALRQRLNLPGPGGAARR